jgi:hypothetical protein
MVNMRGHAFPEDVEMFLHAALVIVLFDQVVLLHYICHLLDLLDLL